MPHAGVLDLVIKTRIQGKKQVARSFRQAWRWYVRGHVVVKKSVELIVNVLKNIANDSVEVEDDGDDSGKTLEPLPSNAEVKLTCNEIWHRLEQNVQKVQDDDKATSKAIKEALKYSAWLWSRYTPRRESFVGEASSTSPRLEFESALRYHRTSLEDGSSPASKNLKKRPHAGIEVNGGFVYPRKLKHVMDQWWAKVQKKPSCPR